MLFAIEKSRWSVQMSAGEDGISFQSGHFGELTVLQSPVFRMKLENPDNAADICELDSASGWGHVRWICEDGLVKLWFADPKDVGDITVAVTGRIDERGISWTADVENDCRSRSVTEIAYPIPAVAGERLNLFLPERSGRAIDDAGRQGFRGSWNYPGISMQYFALWGERSGIYFGAHDPAASVKRLSVTAGEDRAELRIAYYAPGAGEGANSFTAAGSLRWEVFDGDWYDAAMIYADFVHREAEWLPVRGRPDTPKQFREIPYWICDYIPNSKSQRDARPMTLAAVSERYGPDYWTDAAIALKNRLGTPVAYHVYNWHEIPFNIDYPHFLPAKETARQGLKKLRDAGVYVFPYINAVSWEMGDAADGFEENFTNTGSLGVTRYTDGSPVYEQYPQIKLDGTETKLGIMCPTCTRWHEIVESVARGIEEELPVDGIYFDQVAAVPSYPCRSRNHSHRPGGGSWWASGFGRMMEKVQAKRPENRFYFTECNAEAYTKYFDGFLTWVWNTGDAVPAFPAIYAGYIQMIGRYTDGAKRDDDAYFRYHLAESLMYGQQLGWLNAHVVYNEERMRFLEAAVHTRVRYTELFNAGKLMRPPKAESNLPPVTSSGITMRQVLTGVWQTADGEKTVLFAANVSDQPAEAVLHLYPEEYGASCPAELPLTLEPMSIRTVEYEARR